MSPPTVVRSAIGVFFEYDTPKIVHIRSKKVGIINRILQLIIIGYVVGFAIVYKKGYQEFEDVQSAVTTKLKGVVFTNFTTIPGLDGRIWDVADYVVPPLENDAFFVMTNVYVTPSQRQATCEEDPTIGDALCENKTCTPNEPVVNGNGVKTGACLNSTILPGTKVCEIYAWCPVENDNTSTPPYPALGAAKNFTVFIKNNIEFPKFGVQRRNIPDFASDDYLSLCRFNPYDPHDRYCPIFLLDTIVQSAGYAFDDVTKEGAVIQIIITWDCNLDYDESNCLPEYSFRRLDRGDFKVSRGFNFRYADHYKSDNGTSFRTLYKTYGIRFVIVVQGTAGRFGAWPLFLNIGSGIALLSIATVLCDIIVLYILKARSYYRDKKYQDVKGEDAYEAFDEDKSDSESGTRRRQSSISQASTNRSID
ncbi:P2X purinoceptor 4-like isoform X2 [Pomacea canaliculata]|uniref:P2X purinoceptor 4-like isoform X2 n=1 Tax=Pomacea canaliculata TaxID=400727 RepID=UPI000D72C4B1|nr:P2X purinoceptor 4-like isoform X2 [Pomacea canaliculata]